jgi:hypothetical protein
MAPRAWQQPIQPESTLPSVSSIFAEHTVAAGPEVQVRAAARRSYRFAPARLLLCGPRCAAGRGADKRINHAAVQKRPSLPTVSSPLPECRRTQAFPFFRVERTHIAKVGARGTAPPDLRGIGPPK